MSRLRSLFTVLAVAGVSGPLNADGREPGSVLVYPIHRSAPGFFTVLCVSNTNTDPITEWHTGGLTNVQFEYVNMLPNPFDSQIPLDCYVTDRVEMLTPADTLCVLTACHNAANAEGYVVVTAQDPMSGLKTPWSFNHLVGSELVVTALGARYAINAIPFTSPRVIGCPTDQLQGDYDGQLDFDGIEYEALPETLYIDSFLALGNSSLTLINFTGGTRFNAIAQFDIWNDNEFPLSATKIFRCWFEERLVDVSSVFSEEFLANNTPNDPEELDIDCDEVGDLQTGWATIDGVVAQSAAQTIQNPAFLGTISGGTTSSVDGAHLLWESSERQTNGSFLNFGALSSTVDP